MLALLTLAVAPATLIAQSQEGRVVTYDLITQERDVSPAGTSVKGLVVNGSSPAPVLRFKEGDIARIRVRNGLKNENTSIHWHGLLVPIAMDGVPYLTTPHIPPGGEHIFEFPLRQSGTYWYHSHTGLQEQRGVYGAIVIEPREPQGSFDREHVVVLSDWTNEDPVSVMRTLMMGREWYGIQKNTAQSLFGAWKEGAWSDYWEREKSRVHPMDLSDVAYDAFLANGRQNIQLDAEPGERVLVRFVNAGASTYFHLSSGFGPFTIVASDGQLVDPVEVRRLLMGMGETYDVLITMPETGEGVEVLATAHDRTGSSSIRLGSGKPKGALPPPKPDLYGWGEMASAGMESINPERGMRAATAERPFAPYALLRSPDSTVIPEANDEFSVRTITMRLTGDMTRYVWGFDGKTLSEESVIPVKENEVLRIKLINDTMMHHPIHLHGHFFRLLNGHGDHAPLKHTVDVPPMGTRVIEWIANEEKGDWFFHCHMLYHMDAGMARVFSYLDQEPDHKVQFDPNLINPSFLFLMGSIQSHMTKGGLMLMRGREDFGVTWDVGLGEHTSKEIDATWSHAFDPNFSTILGYRFADQHGVTDRPIAGFRYQLPYLVQSELTLDGEGDSRLDIHKKFQLTSRLSLTTGAEYDTLTGEEWTIGGRWALSKHFGLVMQNGSEHGFGAGITFLF